MRGGTASSRGSRRRGKGGLEAGDGAEGDGPDLPALLLLEAGEIENRLRQHVLSLIEPCLRRQGTFDTRLKEVKASVDHQMEAIGKFQKMWDGAETLRAMVDGFRAELAEWDLQRRGKDQVTGDRLSHHDTELSALRQSLERKAADVNANSRAIKGLSDTLTASQKELAELRKYCSERIDVNRDKIAKLRDEFETRQWALEMEQHQLQDRQTSANMLIDGMKAHLRRVADDVADVVERAADMQLSKATVACVEEQQHEFQEFSQQLNAQVAGLRQQLSGLVSDVKGHLQSALQVVGISTAQQMDDMRGKYGSDADELAGAMQEVKKLVESQKSAAKALRGEMSEVRGSAEGKVGELREIVDSITQRHEAETNALSLEVGQLRKRLKEMDSSGQGRSGSSGARNEVIAMMVESEILAAALDLQDDQDRKSIALFGYKNVEGKHAPYPHREEASKAWTLPELDAGGRRSQSLAPAPTAPRPSGDPTRTPRRKVATVGGEAEGSPVMTIDKRCLSCSGSTATVLAGFKLACLQYAPSPVVYREVPHSRSELIRLRMDLLNQAKEELRSIMD